MLRWFECCLCCCFTCCSCCSWSHAWSHCSCFCRRFRRSVSVAISVFGGILLTVWRWVWQGANNLSQCECDENKQGTGLRAHAPLCRATQAVKCVVALFPSSLASVSLSFRSHFFTLSSWFSLLKYCYSSQSLLVAIFHMFSLYSHDISGVVFTPALSTCRSGQFPSIPQVHNRTCELAESARQLHRAPWPKNLQTSDSATCHAPSSLACLQIEYTAACRSSPQRPRALHAAVALRLLQPCSDHVSTKLLFTVPAPGRL